MLAEPSEELAQHRDGRPSDVVEEHDAALLVFELCDQLAEDLVRVLALHVLLLDAPQEKIEAALAHRCPSEVVELAERRPEQDRSLAEHALDRCGALIDLLEHLGMRDRDEVRVIVRVVADEMTGGRDLFQHLA
jgi:hypothetical protein